MRYRVTYFIGGQIYSITELTNTNDEFFGILKLFELSNNIFKNHSDVHQYLLFGSNEEQEAKRKIAIHCFEGSKDAGTLVIEKIDD